MTSSRPTYGDVVGRATLNAEVTKQATVVAYADDFKLMMIVTLVALPLVFLMKQSQARPGKRRCRSRCAIERRPCDDF